MLDPHIGEPGAPGRLDNRVVLLGRRSGFFDQSKAAVNHADVNAMVDKPHPPFGFQRLNDPGDTIPIPSSRRFLFTPAVGASRRYQYRGWRAQRVAKGWTGTGGRRGGVRYRTP